MLNSCTLNSMLYVLYFTLFHWQYFFFLYFFVLVDLFFYFNFNNVCHRMLSIKCTRNNFFSIFLHPTMSLELLIPHIKYLNFWFNFFCILKRHNFSGSPNFRCKHLILPSHLCTRQIQIKSWIFSTEILFSSNNKARFPIHRKLYVSPNIINYYFTFRTNKTHLHESRCITNE